MPNCIGCTQDTGPAPVHILAIQTGEHVAWHHDCHATVTGCELCQAVTVAYPDVKDADLSVAIHAAPHPYTPEG